MHTHTHVHTLTYIYTQGGGSVHVGTTVNTTQVLLFYTPLLLGMIYNLYVVLGSMGLWETIRRAVAGELELTSALLDPGECVCA